MKRAILLILGVCMSMMGITILGSVVAIQAASAGTVPDTWCGYSYSFYQESVAQDGVDIVAVEANAQCYGPIAYMTINEGIDNGLPYNEAQVASGYTEADNTNSTGNLYAWTYCDQSPSGCFDGGQYYGGYVIIDYHTDGGWYQAGGGLLDDPNCALLGDDTDIICTINLNWTPWTYGP